MKTDNHLSETEKRLRLLKWGVLIGTGLVILVLATLIVTVPAFRELLAATSHYHSVYLMIRAGLYGGTWCAWPAMVRAFKPEVDNQAITRSRRSIMTFFFAYEFLTALPTLSSLRG